MEEHLLQLVKVSPRKPFTSEEVIQILTRHGEPPDWAKQMDEKLIVKIKTAQTQRLAKAEANFRHPSQMHSLGALFESTLTIKNMFISQLAQELDMPVQEIEDYIENRLPAKPLSEAQLMKLAEMTSLAVAEIGRIANETAKPASAKSRRPYPTAADYSATWMVHEDNSKKMNDDLIAMFREKLRATSQEGKSAISFRLCDKRA